MSAPSPPSGDVRAHRAERLIADEGIEGASVSVEGPEREIAAIGVPVDGWERLVGDEGARLAARIRALGFRYVALDLLPSDG